MAFIHQESSFKAKAKPPRTSAVGAAGAETSSAKGYSQAIDGTWDSGPDQRGDLPDRNDFGDAADFVGWYIDQSASKAKLKKLDAYNLYLAYHEGQAFSKGSYQSKPWLMTVAKK